MRTPGILVAAAALLVRFSWAEPPQHTGGPFVEQGAENRVPDDSAIPDGATNVPQVGEAQEARPEPAKAPGRARACPPSVPVPSCRGRRWDEASCRLVCPQRGPKSPPCEMPRTPPACAKAVPHVAWDAAACRWNCAGGVVRPCPGNQQWGFDDFSQTSGCSCGRILPDPPVCPESQDARWDGVLCRFACEPRRICPQGGPMPECGKRRVVWKDCAWSCD